MGIAALINGTTDIANASREMKPDEKAKVRDRFNVLPGETAVAKDGVTVYVNDGNPVQQLTIEQLRGIYSGDITSWKDVGGPDAPIVLYSRENSSGTYAFVKEHVLEGGDYASGAQTLPGTAAVVNAVAKEKNGIGYGGAAYAKGIREVKIVGKDGQAYLPSAENVKSRQVPFVASPLHVHARQAGWRGGGVHRVLPVPGGAGDRHQGRVLPGQVTASPIRHAGDTGPRQYRG